MTTRSSHSQTEEDDDYEADYYGPPPHTCHHCSRTFPAAWTEDYTGLIVDPSMSEQEIRQAVHDGCDFYSHYAKSLYDHKNIPILIERQFRLAAWGQREPSLWARLYINGKTLYTGLDNSLCYVVSPHVISGE
jgi:hypothetical protein